MGRRVLDHGRVALLSWVQPFWVRNHVMRGARLAQPWHEGDPWGSEREGLLHGLLLR